VTAQAEREQSAQVERADADVQPEVVLGHTAIGQFEASPAFGGDPADRAFDLGAVCGVVRA
jgi:hypothetical protein